MELSPSNVEDQPSSCSTGASHSQATGTDDDGHPSTAGLLVDYDALYDRIRQRSQELPSATRPHFDVQHKSLAPRLRPYQAAAVSWMLRAETANEAAAGILADEMGLGKTVEVLALVMNNPRKGLPELERLEPVTIPDEDGKSECGDEPPLVKKPRRSTGGCEECSSRTLMQSIENVVWRFSPDEVKSSIQAVIDTHCENISLTKKCNCDKVNLRARLNAQYQQQLEQYSGLKSLYGTNKKDGQPNGGAFLCICGKPEGALKGLSVECVQCSKRQHSACVHYDTQDPLRGEYFCPACWPSKEPIPSGATLIITPSSICSQWVDEIRRHVLPDSLNPFRILVYQGVAGQGSYQQPRKLASSYDVIITTYDILRKELYFAVDENRERSRRLAATYMPPTSPLLAVQFWRLCLDEAQMVEGSTTRAAEMARKFRAVHKWCVTGTPIQKSLQDLKGLLMFLDLEPAKRVYSDPDALVQLLAPIFWRTRKSQVADQIGIPPQTEQTHWLTFSPVEEHFYGQQASQCARDAMERLNKFVGKDNPERWSVNLSKLDSWTANSLLFPLLRLRQACVHPQMVRGRFLTLRPQSKTLTMEELLRTLIRKAQTECEESQRLRVSATNGLAALHLIRGEHGQAAEKYRDVLRWADELKESLQTDSLQRLHALHNLADVLRTCPEGSIPPTLRDGSLGEEAEELRRKYLGRAQAAVDAALAALSPLTVKAEGLAAELEANRVKLNDMWWTAGLQWVGQAGLADRMVTDVKDKLMTEAGRAKIPQFSNADGLRFFLYSRLEEMEEKRGKVVQQMRRLELSPPDELSTKAADCHLRPGATGRANKTARCPLCLVHDELEDFESLLFAMDDRKGAEDEEEDSAAEDPSAQPDEGPAVLETLRRGTWADSMAERILKALLQFIRKHRCPSAEIQSGGQIHLKLLDGWKKEFRRIRVAWRRTNDRASALDELAMAELRLRLRMPHEESSSKEEGPSHLLDAHQVDLQAAKFQADLICAGNSLKRHMGHVLYLKNLEQAGFGQAGQQNPDPCPVCRGQLGSRWSVLLCGHCFCMECIQLLVEQCKGAKSLRCPICRESNPLGDISYVQVPAKEEGGGGEDGPSVRGSHSTKVHAVVRQLLRIRAEEPGSKCLVFSTWTDVLMIVSRALDENGIRHCSLMAGHGHGGTVSGQLERFKRDPDVTALLLPVQSGANGLNLIEATHVLLMEPVLNPGQELQAVGRVHRIGQTRPTVVHRFLVRKTIEEKMSSMLDHHRSALSSRSAGSVKENPITLADLRNLFVHQQEEEDLL